MDATEIKSKAEQLRATAESLFPGMGARINLRPHRRPTSEDALADLELYNTQVEVELYVPGMGQERDIAEAQAQRDREAALAAEERAAAAEAAKST